jgi:membrane-associated phospholipid phosphatase
VLRRARTAFIAAALSAFLLGLTWVVAIHSGLGQHADQSIFKGFLDLSRPSVDRLARFLARLCSPTPWVYFAAIPVLVALARRRPRVAAAIAVILLGANGTTQLLKPLLAVPRAHYLLGDAKQVVAASWPSGHATAAMSLTLASVLAAPARWRPAVAALGASFAVAVSYSFLTLGWHYPSDVLGGFLIAAAWTFVVVGVVFTLDARRNRAPAVSAAPARTSLRQTLTPPAVTLVVGAALAVLVALARPHQVAVYARAHEAFVIGASVIALLGLCVATAVSFAVRR